jgi:hypothetical protein
MHIDDRQSVHLSVVHHDDGFHERLFRSGDADPLTHDIANAPFGSVPERAEEGARRVGTRSESDQVGHRGDTDQSTGLNDRSATDPVIPQHRNRVGRPHVWS